jgi:hypothetical protein
MYFLLVEEVGTTDDSDVVDYYVDIVAVNEPYECEGGLVILFGCYNDEDDADAAYAEAVAYIKSDDDEPPEQRFSEEHCVIWTRRPIAEGPCRVEATLGLEYQSARHEVITFLGVEKEGSMSQQVFDQYVDNLNRSEKPVPQEGMVHESTIRITVGEA